MRTLLAVTIIFLSLLSCNKKNKTITLVGSTSSINHLTIVINNGLWKGSVGDSLRKIIAAPVLGLPQEENQFSVTQVPVKAFSRMFKTNRNLLFIGVENKEGFVVKKNLYASPQVAMTIIGKDNISLLDLISAHKEEIISVFKKADLKLSQRRTTKDHWKIEYQNVVKTKLPTKDT